MILGFSDCSYKNLTYPEVRFGPMIPTPNIDELALQGVRMESYYVAQVFNHPSALLILSSLSLLSMQYQHPIVSSSLSLSMELTWVHM